MHLEQAKAFLRDNNIKVAKSETLKGLLIKEGRECYEHDLTSLSEHLDSSSDPTIR